MWTLDRSDRGFTLIELLVVLIIIGILAAIAVPLLLVQRQKANDRAALADVSTLGKGIFSYYVEGIGTPGVGIVDGHWQVEDEVMSPVSPGVVLESVTIVDDSEWCVVVHNDNGADTTTAAGGASYSASDGLQVGAETCG